MMTIPMGEISTLAVNAPGSASLRTTVPMNIIRQWNLSAGDKIEWYWEARDNKMIVVVRKAVVAAKTKEKEKRKRKNEHDLS